MITKSQFEQQCHGWFLEGGWEKVFGPDIAHDGTSSFRRPCPLATVRDTLRPSC